MLPTSWFKNAVFYHILIDRFAGCTSFKNKPDFQGGNIRGIIEKLDYIEGLDVNAIWLSPFYETREYHGYHITNFREVDPHFGNIDDLKRLIQEAHKRNLKVIADFVPNHCSVYHPWFVEAQNNSDSRYRQWFCFTKWPKEYLSFLDYKILPKINLDYPEAREYMIETAKYWLLFGLDGFRIDHIIGPSHDFNKAFYWSIKKDYPEAVLFGEAWANGTKWHDYKTISIKHKFLRKLFGISQEKIQLEYRNETDGILDFKLNYLLLEAIRKPDSISENSKLKRKVQKHLKKYSSDFITVAFLDNHDVNRFLYYCGGDTDRMLQALEFLLSLNIPLAIYYGTEQGMYNKEPLSHKIPYADLVVRELLDWESMDMELYMRIRDLILDYRKR